MELQGDLFRVSQSTQKGESSTAGIRFRRKPLLESASQHRIRKSRSQGEQGMSLNRSDVQDL